MDRNIMLGKVKQYRALQQRFREYISGDFAQVFAPGNEYGIEVVSVTPVCVALSILDHPHRARFAVTHTHPMHGRIIFDRKDDSDHWHAVLELFFDRRGNMTEKPDPQFWKYSLDASDTMDFVATRLLECFFAVGNEKQD